MSVIATAGTRAMATAPALDMATSSGSTVSGICGFIAGLASYDFWVGQKKKTNGRYVGRG